MTVLVVGRARVARDFMIACQYGGRDYVSLDPAAHSDLDVDQARHLLAVTVYEHEVQAIVDGSVPFDDDIFAEACYHLAQETRLPIIRALVDSYAAPGGPPGWIWVDSADQVLRHVLALGKRCLVTDLSSSLAAGLEELGMPADLVRWSSLIANGRGPRPGRSARGLDRSIELLRGASIDAVVVADRGDSDAYALLAGAEYLDLPVIAFRRQEPWRLAVGRVPPREARDVLAVAHWLLAIEKGDAATLTDATDPPSN